MPTKTTKRKQADSGPKKGQTEKVRVLSSPEKDAASSGELTSSDEEPEQNLNNNAGGCTAGSKTVKVVKTKTVSRRSRSRSRSNSHSWSGTPAKQTGKGGKKKSSSQKQVPSTSKDSSVPPTESSTLSEDDQLSVIFQQAGVADCDFAENHGREN